MDQHQPGRTTDGPQDPSGGDEPGTTAGRPGTDPRDRVAEVLTEGAGLARALGERLTRLLDEDRTRPAGPVPASAPVPDRAPAPDPGAASAPAASHVPAGAGAPPEDPEDPEDLDEADSALDDAALPLRRLVAARLGVDPRQVRVQVQVDTGPTVDTGPAGPSVTVPRTTTAAGGRTPADPVGVGPSVGAPGDALVQTMEDLAQRVRARVAAEVGGRLPDLVAEVRLPADGRPTVRLRPSSPRAAAPSRPSPATGPSAPSPPGVDLAAVLRRLLGDPTA